jgi:hypothetical protein
MGTGTQRLLLSPLTGGSKRGAACGTVGWLIGGLVTGAGLTLSGRSTGGKVEGEGRLVGRGTEEAQDTSMPTITTLHAAR